MNKNIELMAPAGSFEALKAAVGAGANAVYLGGSRFGARQFANNFDADELKKAVQFAHLRDVRVYVTVNTLVLDSELSDATDYLIYLYKIGVDAIIVQDLAILQLAKKVVPNLDIFASTQLTITDSLGVQFAKDVGFKRVVLARELSLDDIQEICANTDMQIEAFVHGALCMCYSGQCLMSSLIGARSGNRGQCAQPCRLPYFLVDEFGKEVLVDNPLGKYLLSPKDLNTIELIPELIKAGVHSFKIEGRMKRPEYVAVVTSVYRKAIDSYLSGNFQLDKQDINDLRQIFNRDFTTAYLKENPQREILSEQRPNNRGVLIGRVVERDWESIKIKLDLPISIGDQLQVWVSVGGRENFTLEKMFIDDKEVSYADKGQIVKIAFGQKVSINDRVFRTLDTNLMQKAKDFFSDKNLSLPVDAKVQVVLNKPLTVTFTDDKGIIGIGKSEFLAQTALKHPLTVETLQKQLERLGDTDFYLRNLEADLQDILMVPVSEINKARRQAIDNLQTARLNAFLTRDTVVNDKVSFGQQTKNQIFTTKLSVHVDSLNKVKTALTAGADRIIFGGDTYNNQSLSFDDYKKAKNLVQEQNKQLFLATGRIVNQKQHLYFQKMQEDFSSINPDGVLISSLSAFECFKNSNLKLWIDYSLNIFNFIAVDFWQKQNVSGVTTSLELTMAQILALQDKSSLPIECIVHGNSEMMVTKYCAIGSLLSSGDCCTKPCQSGKYFFKDRMDELFPLVTDQFCNMHILNAKELCLVEDINRLQDASIASVRIDARYMDDNKLKHIVSMYRKSLDGREYTNDCRAITKGHYFRGVM